MMCGVHCSTPCWHDQKLILQKVHAEPRQSCAQRLVHKTLAPRHSHDYHICQESRKCCCLSRLDGLSHSDHQDAPLVKQALRTEKPQFFGNAPFVLSLWRFQDAAPFSPLVDEHPSRKLRPSKSVLVALAFHLFTSNTGRKQTLQSSSRQQLISSSRWRSAPSAPS